MPWPCRSHKEEIDMKGEGPRRELGLWPNSNDNLQCSSLRLA